MKRQKDHEAMRALLTADYAQDQKERLSRLLEIRSAGFALTNDFHNLLSEDELIAALGDSEILIVSYEPVTARVIAACPDLRLVASIRGGPEENIDVAAATEAGLPVLRTIGRTQRPVSEHALLLILALARPLVAGTTMLRAGQWSPAVMETPGGAARLTALSDDTTELHGKTLGLVGLGNIAERVGRLGAAFGMRVIAFDPYIDAGRAAALGVTLTSLERLLAEADYVSLHARVSAETTGLIGAAQLRLMKPSACLINTARAALLDMPALLRVLREGRIRAAALDVFDVEPLPDDHPVFSIPPERLLLTPHLAGFSRERIPYHSEYLARGIENYLNGVMPEGVFDPAVFDKPAFAARGGRLFGRKAAVS